MDRHSVNRWRVACTLVALASIAPVLAAASYTLLGRAAPTFALHATQGGNVRLEEHAGEVVVLSFWSSRCNTCRAQLDILNRVYATYRSAGLVVFGVGVDDDQAAALEFARARAVAFPMLLDAAKGVARDYQVDNLPMTVFVDRRGVVRAVYRDLDKNAEQTYQRALRPLLDE